MDQNKRLEKPQPALTHERWEMQSPSCYSEGLVMSESCHLLVAAALALGGFSRSSMASLATPGAAVRAGRASPGSTDPAVREAAEREKPRGNKCC